MERAAGGDASSDVALANASVTDGPWTTRDNEALYRRPPARPRAADDTGSGWFAAEDDRRALDQRRLTTTGEQRVVQIPAEPEYGPATPSGSSRASFGFPAGPISPVRQTSAPPAPAAPVGSPAADFPLAGSPAVDVNGSPAPGSSSGWPPPERVDRADLGRVPGSEQPVAGGRPAGTGSRPGDTGDLADRLGDLVSPSGPRDVGSFADLGGGPGDVGGRRAELGAGSEDVSGRTRSRAGAAADPADEPPRQSRTVTLAIVLLSVIVLISGTVVGVVYYSGSDGKLDSVLQLGAGDTGQRTVTAPLDNRTTASFELLAAANRVQVRIGELGDDLYRISTPEDAGIRPSPEIRNDDVKLQVIRDGDGIGGEIEVVLAAKVRWALRFSGYAEQQVLDLTGGQVSGIEMVAGVRRAELTLAQPTGTVPVKVNGAVEDLRMTSPAANPVRVRVDGGAKTVVAGSRTLRDVPAGSTLTPKNWATQNRYDVAAGARITSLTVESA